MSFIPLSRELFEITTIKLNPQIHFVSSSVGEIPTTGSTYVSPIRSKCIKDIVKNPNRAEGNISAFSVDDFNAISSLKIAKNKTITEASTYNSPGINILPYMLDYISSSNQSPKNIRYSKFLDIFRFDTPLKFNLNHVVKRNLNNVLYPYHKHRYPSSGIHYTNFNCLNFYTSNSVPDDSCLLYPNKSDVYNPPKGFTLDFWINPRYDNETAGSSYSAGTIFHMSSSIAVSLVTGSLTDEHNLVDDYITVKS